MWDKDFDPNVEKTKAANYTIEHWLEDNGYSTLLDAVEDYGYNSVVPAACYYGCAVEPDGKCPHGKKSILLHAGVI